MASTNAYTRIVLLCAAALYRRKERILSQLLLVGSRCHFFLCRDDRSHLSVLHQTHIPINRRITACIGPIVSDLLILALHHATDQRFNSGLHLVFAPQLKYPLISFLLRVISHAQSCLVWVVRIKRISEEIQPFHHHEFHRFVELGGICADLVALGALPSGLGSRDK